MTEHRKSLTRRQAIQGAVALLGGSLTAAQLGPLAASVAAMDAAASARFLSPGQFALLERVVDLMIPETDTPGARTVGVHIFVDMMLAEWASPARQKRYAQGLDNIAALAKERMSGEFLASAETQQLEFLEALDAEAYAEEAQKPFFLELKKLVLFGYYTSETGATVELKYDPIPGENRGCVPMKDVGRAWFTQEFSYGL